MRPSIRFVITDVPMWLSHDGLTEVIREHKKKNPLFAKTLQADGGLVLFINAARTRAKLYADGGEVIGYLRLPTRRMMNEDTIDLIPKTFGGSVEYSRAVKAAFRGFFEAEKGSKARPAAKTRLLEERSA